MSIELIYHIDPGHGWMQVPLSLIPESLKTGISKFSYCDATNVYLEEDCDIAPVLKYLNDTGMKIEVKQSFTDFDSPVRNMRHWGVK